MNWDGGVYDKYRIEHTDGTPLKGKKYFVLRLDSDDPMEAARVAAAMRAYKSEPRNCDVGTVDEQYKRFNKFCSNNRGDCTNEPRCSKCPLDRSASCRLGWAQMPYEAKEWDISWSITSPTGTVFGNDRISGAKIMDAINKFLCKRGNGEKRIIGIEMVDKKHKKKNDK